jgi:hypothetical protein
MNNSVPRLHSALLRTLSILFFILFVILTVLNLMSYVDVSLGPVKKEHLQFFTLFFMVSIPWVRVLFKSALLFLRNQKILSGMCLFSLIIIWTAIFLSGLTN